MSRKPVTASACLIVLAFTTTSGFAQDYDLFQIPLPPGWTSMFPFAINDHGHAVGINAPGFFQMPKGFYFDGETSHEFAKEFLESLPYEPWQVGVRPLDINNENQVLFTLEVTDVGVFSYLWDGDSFTQIQPAVPGMVGASSINNNGLIVGTYNTVTPQSTLENRGWVYDPRSNETTIIEPLHPYEQSVAYSISDTGYVSGYLFGGPVARGFVWKDGEMTLLSMVDATDHLSIGRVVNDAGFTAGLTTNFAQPGTPSLSRVVLWEDAGEVVHWEYPLGNLTGFDVAGLNDNNEVVGTMLGPQQAFHFRDGVIRNLNNHFEQPTGGLVLDLWDAYDINASGQIAVQGQFVGGTDWNNYGFILTPKSVCDLVDLNCSGEVDVADLLILLGAWGECPSEGDCLADLDGSGSVGVLDLLILLGSWS